MNVQLRTTAGILGIVLVATLVAVGTWLGCRAQFSGTSDGGSTGDDFLATGQTLSFFTAIQVDPRSEDSAGPQFVTAADIDGDGLMDLVSAWNQSQPVQIHFQRRNAAGEISFETVTLAGNIPVVRVAGLSVADFDQNGAPDIAVLLKQTLEVGGTCLNGEVAQGGGSSGLVLIYLAPVDATQVDQALAWKETPVEASRLAGNGADFETPEVGGFTSMAVGDIDMDGDMDIVVAWNSSCGEGGTIDVVLFSNEGPSAVRDGTWVATPIPNSIPVGTAVKDVALGDIDADGDLDIVATFPDAGSMNIRWFRNPTLDVVDDFHISDGIWQVGTVAQIATQADVIKIADLDGDGLLDVVMRSTAGKLIQWLKGPGMQATTAPLPQIPWQVYTLAEFTERTPQALAVGDINADGQVEVVVTAAGGLLWLDPQSAPTVYDQWIENLIVDDEPPGQPGNAPPTTDPNVTPTEVAGTTFINSILVVDLDGDGANDIVATFDRSGLSGLSNDALVWFRNTR